MDIVYVGAGEFDALSAEMGSFAFQTGLIGVLTRAPMYIQTLWAYKMTVY